VLEAVDFMGSVEFSDFELFFALFLGLLFFVPFVGVAVSPLLDDFLEPFFGFFGLLAVLHEVLDSYFKLYTFCCQ
jgi:hypothetical protein